MWYTTSIASLPSVGITSKICLLTATLLIRIIHRLTHCYQTIRQIAKKLLLKGSKFILGWLVGVSTLHVSARSPNLTMKTLILSVTHMMWCGSIKALVVRCWYRLVNTLGLYVNALEYTELLNRLIFDRVYGS